MSAQVLIVIPTYNEASNVEPIAKAIRSALPTADILFVDDSSPDGTGRRIRSLAEKDERVFLLTRPAKSGFGRAYQAGFEYGLARAYRVLVQMDADFSHPPDRLAVLLEGLRDRDLVIGSRYVAGGSTPDWGVGRILLSRSGNFYARAVLRLGIRDMTAGFMAWRSASLRSLQPSGLGCEGYAFLIELKLKAVRAGLRVREIPICFQDRRVGQSKMDSRIAFEAVRMVWQLRR